MKIVGAWGPEGLKLKEGRDKNRFEDWITS
jgi:hypothetical protein